MPLKKILMPLCPSLRLCVKLKTQSRRLQSFFLAEFQDAG
jgi:hypothetical protein